MERKYDPKLIKARLEIILTARTCIKHPITAVIETIDGRYIDGWNGAPTNCKGHYKCLRADMPSGEGMEICPSIHAERRAISNAARDGIKTDGGTIYLNEWFPCADCAKSIIEAGLVRLVTPDELYFNENKHILVKKLQKQPYNFEMAEKLIMEAGIEIIIDPLIRIK